MNRIAQTISVFAFATCTALVPATSVQAASAEPTQYMFTTETYDTVFDHYLTPTRYTMDMNIEMSVTFDSPLSPNMNAVPISPDAWSYSDGNYAETDSDLSRFNGRVSTDGDGNITDFMVQVYLNAPSTPGVWVRRDGSGTAYSTAIAREVVIGGSNPCAGHSNCDPIPLTEWAQDRATGNGDIAVSMFISGDSSTGGQGAGGLNSSVVSTPVPLPAVLLGGALLGLGALRRRRRA